MRIKYLSSIRVLGLILVLLYHFFIKYFPGGFLGVDLFFTLSGYLTTALFIDEYSKNRRIDIISFFRKRLYRIMPALVLTILIATPLALFIRNDFLANIGQQIVAALGFMTNFFEIFQGGSYENQFTPHLFVHTWSLAVEVHFYILWALAIWGLTKITTTSTQLRQRIAIISGVGFLVLWFCMLISSFSTSDFSMIYFFTGTRLFPFFLGSLIATSAGIRYIDHRFSYYCRKWHTQTFCAMFLAGFIIELVLLFTFNFNHQATYLIGFLASSFATVLMIYAARALHEKTVHFKEPYFLVFIANISYGIYLFHWPLYTIFLELIPSLAVIITIGLSVFFATLSYYIFEPLLIGKTARLKKVGFPLGPFKIVIISTIGLLALITVHTALTASRLGHLEAKLMADGLHQANRQLNQTKKFAERGKATNYDVTDGITIIGDSVTLGATRQLHAAIPEAIIDARGNRNTAQAHDILKTTIANKTLTKNVIIATGTNAVFNYKEEIHNIIDTLPKGYRLIFVTPYDGNSATYANPLSEKHAKYLQSIVDNYDFISLADWNTVAKQNPQVWSGSDHIHPGPDGATLFAKTIKDALEKATHAPIKQ